MATSVPYFSRPIARHVPSAACLFVRTLVHRLLSKSCSITVTVVNRLGLHARPAMTFVDLASTFTSGIRVRKGETEVDGKSIMQMMMLAASQGSELLVTAEGDDCEAACQAIDRLVKDGFDEE